MARGIVRGQVTPPGWRPTPAGRWRFLADASIVLDASLDYEQTLASTALLAVPEVADYCVVVLVDGAGAIRWTHSAHRDPGKARLLKTWRAHLALACTSEHPVAKSLRTGRAQLVPDVGEKASAWWNTPQVGLLEALSPTSCVAVPLTARGLTFGALLFAVTVESGRRYGARDLELALDVARRAASAIDHALLYRAANRAASARDELMEVVAHDLKNPLNTIKLSLHRLLDDAIPDDLAHRMERESLGRIVRAAERMHRLIRDILDLSQVTGGRLLIQPAPADAVELVQEAVDAHLPLAAAKDIRLAASAATPLPKVLADRDRIAQVFSNLIDNALKFTPAGGRVTVRGSLAHDAVRFLVEDTGPGIPADHHPHVFDRFWQARNTARMGTGLGLSIARAIVEGHRGTIGLESAPGEGSSFHFSLPCARADAAG